MARTFAVNQSTCTTPKYGKRLHRETSRSKLPVSPLSSSKVMKRRFSCEAAYVRKILRTTVTCPLTRLRRRVASSIPRMPRSASSSSMPYSGSSRNIRKERAQAQGFGGTITSGLPGCRDRRLRGGLKLSPSLFIAYNDTARSWC